MNKTTNIVLLSLGGNLGNKSANLEKAEKEISIRLGTIVKSSRVYYSEAWGFESKDSFANKAIAIETSLEPEDLLLEIWEIEKQFGRIREGREIESQKYKNRKMGNGAQYQSRQMDIDIIFYNDLVIDNDILTIPHPLATQRRFVLEPINEIYGNFIHPLLKMPISRLFEIVCEDSK